MKLKYIYSSCVVIETTDIKVLCDPWFTDGIYDGAWFKFPDIKDPILKIGDVDCIYISHIHPDHYDPVFLKSYFNKFGVKPVYIGNFAHNYLEKKMSADGIKYEILNENKVFNDTTLSIIPFDQGKNYDVDSALVCTYNNECIVHLNDCIFNESFLSRVKEQSPGNIDIALIGYAGANSYPHTYYEDESSLLKKSSEKIKFGIERYIKIKDFIGAKKNMPFAGKYILGGKLQHLNKYMGIPDPVIVLEHDSNAFVLNDGGDAYIDTNSLNDEKHLRLQPYEDGLLKKRLNQIKDIKLDYELDIKDSFIKKYPLIKAMRTAYARAIQKSECATDYFWSIKYRDQFISLNSNKNDYQFNISTNVEDLYPRNEIYIDERLLVGLISGLYHWNNAAIGSLYFQKRKPDKFNKDAENFLSFLSLT